MTDYPLPPWPDDVDPVAWFAAVADVRGYCGWHIAPTVTETVTVDGAGCDVQPLPTKYLLDLVSITNDGTLVEDADWSEMGLVGGCRWTGRFRGVVAEMSHGYAAWPEDLLDVIKDLVTAARPGGVQAVTIGDKRVQFEDSLTPRQIATLDRYRIEHP